MRILLKKVGKPLLMAEVSNNLQALQKVVGGPIEVLTIASNLVCVCNEEGRLLNMKDNFNCLGETLVGDVFFCGVREDEFCSLESEIGFKVCKNIVDGGKNR